MIDRADTAANVRDVLQQTLGVDASLFDDATGLFGELPELDSMSVATLLTALEDRLDIVIEDDEVDGEMLASFGALVDYAHGKRTAR